ncbi:MFS transporter [Streptomyces cyanogenus]|uniref:Multidrug resistance protein stp n=1 Tax=Streptomyces cyanogenus TaxID=80860 RepID=A0ABX7TM86_STRCY|nr:MFS transporter [Streptomyces cyanogenus]QTD95999.1 Multidrug resistance protein stp [Streptomyces cyanogenus]
MSRTTGEPATTPATPRTAFAGAPYRWRWIALAALLAAEAMNLLDATIVQVAAPVIHTDLGGTDATIPWFSASYTLAFALGLLTGGRLGDIHGRRRVFRAGIIAFALTSLACALAPTAVVLITLRAVQGVAAAAIIPQTFGLIRAMFTGPELSKALGMIGPVMGLSAVAGPALGGVLTHADLLGASWRAVFLVNLPLAAAVLAAAPCLREDRAPVRPGLDPAGTALAMLGTALLVCPLATGRPGPAAWATAAAGAAVLTVFVAQQRRTARRGKAPLIEPALLRGRSFPAALATSTLFFAVMNGVMITVVLHVELGLHDGPLTAGLTLLPWSTGLAVASWAAGSHLVPRYGSRVMHAGIVTLAGALAAAAFAYRAAAPDAYPTALPLALALAGLGSGLFTPPFFTSALEAVGPQETGSAAGLLNAVQQLGGTLGVALIGGVYLGTTGGPRTAAEHALAAAAVLLAATAAAAGAMTARRTRPAPAAYESGEE